MKIGIDVSPIVYGTGVSIYTKNLVENLLQLDDSNEYTLFFSSLRQKFPGLDNKNFKLKKKIIPPTLLDILWNKFHLIPIEAFIGDVDIFHCSDWTQPPSKKAKLVTTIHDLSFLRRPKTVHPKVLSAQKRRLNWVEKKADGVIAVSEATKREIVELTNIPENKISVIYEDVSGDVKEFKQDRLRVASLKEKFNIKDKYILAMGSQAPRKNIERLIQAYEKIQSSNFQNFKKIKLVVAGRYKSTDKLPEGVITTGFLDRKELLTLISQAEAFVYPSLYEGFGLPILEAFSLKTPVVTSNCSSMAEIADQAAVLVNPQSPKSIAKGIKKVLEDENLRKNLVNRGNKRLDDFSWENTARQTLSVYNSLC